MEMKLASFFAIGFLAATHCSTLSAQNTPPDVLPYLQEKVSRDINQSIIAGSLTFNGTQYFKAGTFSTEDPRPIDEKTLFEIGPVTQLFTASATALLVQDKQIAWTSAVNSFLPTDVDPPTWEGKSIRIHDLATHSAALPKYPLNLDPKKNKNNPYQTYTTDALYKALNQARLPYQPGTRYLYSHYGFALLAHVLELRTSQTYESILQEKIAKPLALKNTTTELKDFQKKQLAPGHLGLESAESWVYNGMTGDGGVYTSAEELLRFVGAHIGLTRTPLTKSFKKLQHNKLTTDLKNTQMAYGWHITQGASDPVHWISGTTGGYSVFMGFNLIRTHAVVVLSNTSQSIDEIGFHMLSPDDYPLPQLPKLFPISPKTLDNYTGTYQLAPEIFVEVTRKGGRLYVQFTGEPKFRVYARTEKTFEYAHGQRFIAFDTKRPGKSRKLTVSENFKKYTAKRLKSATAAK